MMRKQVVTMAVGIALFGSGYWLGGAGYDVGLGKGEGLMKIERKLPLEKQNVDFSLFWTVWDRVEAAYVDESAIKPADMVYGAISGMVSALDDPYTVFLPPKENKSSKEDLGGAFEGVGLQLGFTKEKRLSVVSPLEGSPAQKAGVKSGDLILNILDDKAGVDQDTYDITLPRAVELIRGPKGSVVTLTLFRDGGDKPFEVDLRRDTIVVKSVEVTMKEQNIDGVKTNVAILELNKFGGRTQEEWVEAVQLIKNKGVKHIVLDLRNNPGGYLDGAIWTASEFLESGVVVRQENRDKSTNMTYEVIRKGRLLDEKVIVLVNEGTASAAEILAGALRDNGRAKIIGQKTFGKGTVQQPEDLPGGAGLHVTVGRWLLPSGKWIDKEGVLPDIEVKNDDDEKVDEQLDAAILELI